MPPLVARCLIALLDALSWHLCRLPEGWALAYGRAAGELLCLVQPGQRALIARQHAALFGRPPKSSRRFARAVYRHYGMMAIELLRQPLLTPTSLRRIIDMSELDAERARRARPGSDGSVGALICTSGHWGNWEWTAAAFALAGLPITGVARPLGEGLEPFDAWIDARRRASGLRLVSKFGAVRLLLDLLRDGEIVGLIADQHSVDRGAVRVRYGCEQAWTVPTLARLHLATDAPIAVGAVVRAPGRDGQRYRYRVVRMIDRDPDLSPADDEDEAWLLEQIHDALAQGIAETPEQYAWTYPRWRER